MSANYLDKLAADINKWKWLRSRWAVAVLLPVWVMAGLGLGGVLLNTFLYAFMILGVPFDALNKTVLMTLLAAVLYSFALAVTLGVPWLALRRKTTWKDIGLHRFPSWKDIGLAPAGFIIYFIISSILVLATSPLIGFDLDQKQDIGFTGMAQQYQYVLAFLTLIVVAPVAEEILFRGYLYGKLRRRIPVWLAIVITSALFGLVHGQWNVGVDVFALGVVLCVLRELTGSIWSGILLHMLKNSIAFYILFVNPIL